MALDSSFVKTYSRREEPGSGGYSGHKKDYGFKLHKNLQAKAGIPMRKKSSLAKGKPHRYGNLTNWRLKAVGRTFKRSLLNLRTEVERFFATLKRRYHLGKELTRGLRAFTINAYQSLISYCLNIFYLEGVTNF